MAAPTFDSVTSAAIKAAPTVAQYAQAFSYFVKLGPKDGAKAMGRAQLDFLKMAQKGAIEWNKAFQRSLNV